MPIPAHVLTRILDLRKVSLIPSYLTRKKLFTMLNAHMFILSLLLMFPCSFLVAGGKEET